MTSNVTLVGNATRDVELKYSAKGVAVASFGIAVNRRWQAQNGEWEEKVSFFDVTAFGTLAENAAETVVRGTRVVVVGRLEQRSWETDSGEKRSKVEVTADEVAVSLRWATASVMRTERAESSVHSGSRPASQRRAAPVAPPADDEEPF